MDNIGDRLEGLFGATIVGATGGWICGFILLTVGNFLGQSGNSDASYFGYWDPIPTAGLAVFYGVPLGIVLFDISYMKFLRTVPVGAAIKASFIGALGGGLLGAIRSPLLAAMTGSLGFIVASAHVAERARQQ